MSRWRRSTYSLGVGSRDMAVVDVADTPARIVSMLPLADYLPGADSPETANWEPSMATVMAQTEPEIKGGGNLHVTISDDWARYWMLTPPKGIRSLAELRALAESRFEQLYGTPLAGWTMDADWSTRGGVLACALPTGLLDSMRQVCAKHNWSILSIVPQATRLINARRARIGAHGWVCSFSTHTFLALLLDGGQLLHARQFRFETLPSIEEVFTRLETELLRIGRDMPPEVCFLGKTPDLRGQNTWHGTRLVAPGEGDQAQVVSGAGRRSTSEACLLALQGGMA